MVPSASDELVRRAKAGDRFAFDELAGPLVDQGFRLAYGMLHDREAAEDAVQEATLRAWRKINNLRPGTEMRPWFLAIVANQCRTTARGRWWSVIRLSAPSTPGTPDFEDEIVRGAELRAALRRLSPDHREALVLRYYLDLSVEEVASITGVAVGTVKSRLNRGMAAMRPHFKPGEALI